MNVWPTFSPAALTSTQSKPQRFRVAAALMVSAMRLLISSAVISMQSEDWKMAVGSGSKPLNTRPIVASW